MALCMHQGLTLGWSMLPQWFKAGGVLVLCFALGGCASITLNAVQDGQLVAAGPISGVEVVRQGVRTQPCLLYTSPSPRDRTRSRMPSSA